MNDYKVMACKNFLEIKNNILEIKRNKKRLVGYIFYAIFIAAMIGQFIFTKPHNKVLRKDNLIAGAIIAGILFLIFLWSMYNATKECPTFFSGGDMNLMFTSPISSKNILLFGMIKQTIKYFLFGGFFVIFQLPMLRLNTTLDFSKAWLIYFGVGLAVMSLVPLGFLLYTIGVKYDITSKIKKVIIALIILLAMWVAYSALTSNDILTGLLNSMTGKHMVYIPIIGWLYTILMSSILGITSKLYFCIAAQVLTIILCIYGAYQLADDYYEDVIGATDKVEKLKSIRSGEEKYEFGSKVVFNKNKKIEVKSLGSGAKAFVWKEIVTNKRTTIIPYVGIFTILLAILGVTIGLAMDKEVKVLYMINGMIGYIYLIMSTMNPLENELSKHYFYLTPDSVIKKIMAASRSTIIQTLINVSIFNVTSVLLGGYNIGLLFVFIPFTLSFYIFAIFSTMLVRFIIPNSIDQTAFLPLIKLFQMLLVALPAGIIGGILAFIFKSEAVVFAGIAIQNLILSFVILLFSQILFERIELKD